MSGGAIIEDETGAQRMVGYTLDVGQPDRRARCRLVLDERHTNRHGVLHGGIAGMLLDSAAGATASLTVDDSGRQPFLTVSLNIDYVGPALKGGVTATGARGAGAPAGGVSVGTFDAGCAGVFRRMSPMGSWTGRASRGAS